MRTRDVDVYDNSKEFSGRILADFCEHKRAPSGNAMAVNVADVTPRLTRAVLTPGLLEPRRRRARELANVCCSPAQAATTRVWLPGYQVMTSVASAACGGGAIPPRLKYGLAPLTVRPGS
jgi:hypothetical protein